MLIRVMVTRNMLCLAFHERGWYRYSIVVQAYSAFSDNLSLAVDSGVMNCAKVRVGCIRIGDNDECIRPIDGLYPPGVGLSFKRINSRWFILIALEDQYCNDDKCRYGKDDEKSLGSRLTELTFKWCLNCPAHECLQVI